MTVTVRALGLILVLVGAVATPTAQPKPDAAKVKQQLIGSYRLVSFVQFDEKGVERKTNYTVGQISYDAAGRMSAQLMASDRPRIAQGGQATRPTHSASPRSRATSPTSAATRSTPNAASSRTTSRGRSPRTCWDRRCRGGTSSRPTARRSI